MNNKYKFLMSLSLVCLSFGQLTADQGKSTGMPALNQEMQPGVKITGRVTAVNGEPILGASIVEKGTSNQTITDTNGNFTLNVKANAALVVSYVGYVTEEIVASTGGNLNIVLSEDTETLDEVVVVGYGSVKKSDLTGSVASVSTKEFLLGIISKTGWLIRKRIHVTTCVRLSMYNPKIT